jgi:copper resistance protein B
MNMIVKHSPMLTSCRALATALLLALPLLASGQSAEPATPDHAHMHHATPDEKSDMHHMHDATATPVAPMLPMHHGDAAGEQRSPDYSDGIGHGSMPGMHMIDDQPLAMLRVDQLEVTSGRYANGQAWDVQGWYGNDGNKLWLRSEGERSRGRIDHGEVELLWSHAVAPFWDTQLGVRQDLGRGPQRRWVAFGIQGMAPYWFELEATAYAGPSGRTAARLRVEYELLFTQRLILQPEFELNLHGRNDVATRTGRGLSDTQFGLRLRYEIRREFAPYIGVVWTQHYGATADYARQDGEPATDRQLVAGVRFWF